MSRIYGDLVTVVSGGVLLLSGLIHLNNPILFSTFVSAYGMVPQLLVLPVALSIPAVYVLLAVNSFFRPTVWVRLGIAGTFAALVVIQCKVLMSGERISCGCFGFNTEEISLKSLALPSVMLAMNLTSLGFYVRGSIDRSAGWHSSDFDTTNIEEN